ncbi:hypothetical protein Bca52824_060590 [Brassica carinata]|uniref:Uncharacterized protein n=1 Tax=Brassica carinata TaxID=52824 RepID=A0A8X7R078_BRACI|nr:hypothetical protein Bca52824_060590 [Brassica carinata]
MLADLRFMLVVEPAAFIPLDSLPIFPVMRAGNGTRGLRPASDCRGYSLVMRAGSRSRVAPSRLFVTRVETIDTNPRHLPALDF